MATQCFFSKLSFGLFPYSDSLLLSAREFFSTGKFMMLGLLTFTIFNFLMAKSLEVLFFETNLVCFQKWSRLRIVPALFRLPFEPETKNGPAKIRPCWCSVSRHIKIRSLRTCPCKNRPLKFSWKMDCLLFFYTSQTTYAMNENGLYFD